MHDGDAVADIQHLLHIAADHEDDGAAVGEGAHEAVDLGLGTDIDAAGGFVQDHDARVHGEPFAEDDLLLVAAAEIKDAGFDGRGLDLHGLHLFGGEFPFAAAIDEAGPGEPGQVGQGNVFAHGHLHHEALGAAVFRGEVDAVVDGIAGAADG